MELEFKPDFESIRQRWDRYWRGEPMDRPIVGAMRRKDRADPKPQPHAYTLPFRDAGAFADDVLAWAASMEFLGDMIPHYTVTFAPDHFALLLGADMIHSGQMGMDESAKTGWITPFLDDYDTEIRFRPEGKWWATTVEGIRALRQRCDGRLIVAGTHLQGGLDALAAIRDPQRLLLDLIERPDDVKGALDQIDRAVNEVRAVLSAELNVSRFGTVTRHNSYSRAWTDVPQCDFSCMISPEMFREFGIPSLCHDCVGLDGAIYHLDGPGAIKHVPALCEIEKIRAIQWQPGAGAPATMDWSGLYRDIDARGKGLFYRGRHDVVRGLWRESRSRELHAIVTDIDSKSEMDDFLAELSAMKPE